MKPILRLLHAKLAFHPLSPKKKHCINAHYPETWGLFKSPPFLLFSFALSSALLPPSAPLLPRLHSLFPRTLAPVPPLRACTCALPCALAHTRASADFRFLPSPFTALSQLTVYQDTRGEHLSTLSPSPFLHLPSRDSPYLANCKISHRAGEGIFLKAFTPYALIYCALRPTGEEVKEKNEKHLTRAREETRKTHLLHLVASRRGRTFASPTLQRLFSSCHIAFPSFATKPNHVAGRKERHVRSL